MSRATEGFSASTATLPGSADSIVYSSLTAAQRSVRSSDLVPFADESRQLLPADLPFREECIGGAARHLELIVEANRHLT